MSVLIAALTCLAMGQVNTERLRLSPEGEGVTGSVTLALTGLTGNVDYFETAGSVGVAQRWGDNLLFGVITSKYATKRKRADRLAEPEGSLFDRDRRYTNAHLAAARYNRFFTEEVIGEVFVQAEYNQFLLLDLRALVGAGPRLAVFDQEHAQGWVGVAAMAELERLDPEEIAPDEQEQRLTPRATAYLTLSAQVAEGTSLSTTSYYQPSLLGPGDYRVYNDTQLGLQVSERLTWEILVTLRHDASPPRLALAEGEDVPLREQTLRSTDGQIVNKLSLKF
ncbi:MAG: DUF481 domain-containing protein [Deltaproteobacteria bacterium]|nr:DUF481 domain-containing protein [Deltaproteobacteria bacterium]